MVLKDQQYFQKLKETLQQKVQLNLGIEKRFPDWSLNDIRDFQADLESKCKSTVSEKWFYTHFKNTSDKLPRVDVLHLLSSYCGYKNWDDYKQSNNSPVQIPRKRNKYYAIATLSFVAILIMVWGFWPATNNKVVLVFEDAFTHELIHGNQLKITSEKGVLRAQESGVVWVKGKKYNSLNVDGAYYIPTEVFSEQFQNLDTLRVELFPDDYALLLNFFSRSTLKNWEKRRVQLDSLIHVDATLFEMHEELNGIDMLNKTEFIERMTLPINSLKNLEILDIVYKEGKIYKLRFVQKEK